MIRAIFPAPDLTAAAGAAGSRTISGTAVPWNVVGTVSDGRRVMFLPGSLDAALRPTALRDHDRTRPIGKVTAATDDGQRLTATIRASAVGDGNDALVLAADGALSAFSVGATPTDWTFDDDGVLVVAAAAWEELSLLTFGAFPDATVSDVTATRPDERSPMNITTAAPPAIALAAAADPPDTDVDDDETVTGDDDDDETTVETPPVPTALVVAGAPRRRGAAAFTDIDVAGLSRVLGAAVSGAMAPARAMSIVRAAIRADADIVQAALADVTLVGANNVNYARPTYASELVEMIAWGRPTVDAVSHGSLERGDYPNKAFSVWSTGPTVGVQAAEKTAITSTPVDINAASTPVITWAGGNDISQQTIDFGAPGFVEDYIRAAAADFAHKSNIYAVTQLLAGATAVTGTAAASFIDNLGAMFAALDPTKVPRSSLILGMSYDIGASLMGITADKAPAFWDGSVSFGKFIPTATVGGLSAYVDPDFPANTMALGPTDGVRWWEWPGSPASLRVTDVNLLGLDVAVYGYGAFAYRYPGSFVKMNPLAA